MTNRALVLCEGYFATTTAKTAHGLLRRSRKYEIVGIIDRTLAGRDAGEVLDGVPSGVPVVASLEEGVRRSGADTLVVGVATFGGRLPEGLRPAVREALERGLHVVSGLHEYLSEDPELAAVAARSGARITDVRKPRPLAELRQFEDLARRLPCLRVPVLGTDGAIGKRTTAWVLTDALNEAGVPAAFVATGQTGLIQGADFGLAIDGVRGDFVVGELEGEIVRAYGRSRAKVIVIEGQGSISHPAYVLGTRAILMAAQPQAIVLQHAPGRKTRSFRRDVLSLPMPDVGKEIGMLESYSSGRVVAITVNHEGMTREAVDEVVAAYEASFGLPTCDPLWHGVAKVVAAIRARL